MPAVDRVRPEELPIRFGRMELVSLLGEGGMGRVFEAVLLGEAGFRKRLALKVIRSAVSSHAEGLASDLVAEARTGGLLHHPGIVDVYDFGVTSGQPWIAMELVEGCSLADLLVRAGALPPRLVVDLGLAIASALDHAHSLMAGPVQRGVVHRDLKPSNVLLGRNGEVKVVDFGLARAVDTAVGRTEPDGSRGTPAYMSPEQASGRTLDGRSDLFALGALLLEMATGERLLLGDTIVQVMMSLVRVDERLADAGLAGAVEERLPGLFQVVARCCRPDPEDRFPGAAEVEGELSRLSASVPPGPSLKAFVRDVLDGGDGGTVEIPTVALSTAARAGLPRTNLGEEADSFFGRDAALACVRQAFGDGARLVTVVGPGGTGKTRLALRFARERVAAFPGGTWFCDLAEARDLPGLLRCLASPLGLSMSAQGDDEDLIGRLGHAIARRGPTLLLLDNFEQLAAFAPVTLSRWLVRCPEARFVVTSRERLRLPGEALVELGPLTVDEAVALFVDRARAVSPGAAPSAGEKAAIHELVRRLDGLPLAVELAAARARMLPPAQLLARLDERLRLLRGSRISGRQATLHSTIAWSWDLLQPAEQAALCQLCLFRGGFGLEAAEAALRRVVPSSDVLPLDLVEALRDKSLLHSRQVPELGGEVRFGLYESIRQFAAERLAVAGGAASAERCWAEAVLAQAEPLLARVDGHGGTEAARRLSFETENLLAVFGRYSPGEPLLAGRALACALPRLEGSGPYPTLMAALEAADAWIDSIPARLAAPILRISARMERIRDASDHGEARIRRAAQRLRDAGLDLEADIALCDLAYTNRGAAPGRAASAEHCRRTLERVRDRGLPMEEGLVLSALAMVEGSPGDEEWRIGVNAMALAAHRRAGNRRKEGIELLNVGTVAAVAGRLDDAQARFEEALAVNREVGYDRGEGVALAFLGAVALERGDLDRAERLHALAARRLEEVGDTMMLREFASSQVQVAQLRGALAEADAHARRLVAASGDAGAERERGNAIVVRGMLRHEQRRMVEAEADYEAAAACYRRAGVALDRAVVASLRASLLADQDRVEPALQALASAASEGSDDQRAAQGALLADGHLDLARARAQIDPELRAWHLDLAVSRLEHSLAADVPGAELRVARQLLRRAIERTRQGSGAGPG